jgi:hypothetical protein
VLGILANRQARTALGWVGVTVGLIGLATVAVERRAAMRQRDFLRGQAAHARQAENNAAPVEASWEGRAFRRGDRVRIANRSGTFKPEETGFSREVDADDGHTGVVLSGERRASTEQIHIDPKEPIQIVKVRWAAQKWKIDGEEQWVALPEFEATIHVSYLEVVP